MAADIAAIVAAIAESKGFAAINDLTASAAVLKPFATPLRTLVVPFPFFERSSTAPATPLTDFVILEFASEAACPKPEKAFFRPCSDLIPSSIAEKD